MAIPTKLLAQQETADSFFTDKRVEIRHVDLFDMPDALNTDHDNRYVRRNGAITGTTRITTTYTILLSDTNIMADTDGGVFTVTLPAGLDGMYYRIVNVGTSSNNLTIAPNGTELLIGVNSNWTLLDGEALIIVYETMEGWY